MTDWDPQQYQAIEKAVRWFEDYQSGKPVPMVHRIFGYAGTGKTTMAKHIAKMCGGQGNVMFGAYTGKASLVLRSKGCLGASTLHSTIYETEVDQDGVPHWHLNKKSILKQALLLIIDECSMVDEKLGRDVMSFRVPILVLGDPAQLPPPNGAGFFTNHQPDSMLTEVHRQAAENPIIWMATQVRNEIMLDPGTYGDSIVSSKADISLIDEYDQVICGLNKTRHLLNAQSRAYLGYNHDYPMIGERMICLKNDSKLGINNGGSFEVHALNDEKNGLDKNFWRARLKDTDFDLGVVDVKVHRHFLNPEVPAAKDWRWLKGSQEFDYGYAITCHKSQGSQYDGVLVFDESRYFRENWHRWLYTAITRAADKVRIVV